MSDRATTLPPSRPMVRYHGGKWRLAPWIVSHFPEHRVYVEPFGGAASVLLRKWRSHAEVYNDLDGEMVNLFRVARDRGEELVRAVEMTPFAREEFELSYEEAEDAVERARRTVARCYMGFGSNALNRSTGFRACSTRSGTTPAADWRNFPEALRAIVERLRGVVVECREAAEVMRTHDGPGTLHYVDPPYVAESRSGWSEYRHEMTAEDHAALAGMLGDLEGAVVLSGYGSDLYGDLFAGWDRVECRAMADGARERRECLWLRNVEVTGDLFGDVELTGGVR